MTTRNEKGCSQNPFKVQEKSISARRATENELNKNNKAPKKGGLIKMKCSFNYLAAAKRRATSSQFTVSKKASI